MSKESSTIPAELIYEENNNTFAMHSSMLRFSWRFGVPGNTEVTENQANTIGFDPEPVELMTQMGKEFVKAIPESG